MLRVPQGAPPVCMHLWSNIAPAELRSPVRVLGTVEVPQYFWRRTAVVAQNSRYLLPKITSENATRTGPAFFCVCTSSSVCHFFDLLQHHLLWACYPIRRCSVFVMTKKGESVTRNGVEFSIVTAERVYI